MPYRSFGQLYLVIFIFSFLVLGNSVFAQRLVLPQSSSAPPKVTSFDWNVASNPSEATQILKIYPDGTRKIVPLAALNFRDDGAIYGGPPKLSLYSQDDPSAKKISLAPIGLADPAGTLPVGTPSTLDPTQTSLITAAGDPMGGGGSADPMAGTGPADPLAGSPSPTSAPPLQTVSGKAAPLVGDSSSIQLGVWDGFFLNAGVGGSLQNQLNARRIWSGAGRQAYPYTNTWNLNGTTVSGKVTGESFVFQPGFRFDTEFGYNFYEWLGISLQTGMTYNGLDNYTITGNFGNDGSGSFRFDADGELIQVPIQLNGIFRWPGNIPLRPFVGFGVGAVWQELNVDSVYIEESRYSGNYGRSGFQFGWNAQLGLTYVVQPGVDFYSSLKVLSACMPVIGNYQFQNTYNLAIEVGIQSRF